MKEKSNLINRFIAFLVLISFTLLNTSYRTYGYAETPPPDGVPQGKGSVHPHHGISQADPMALIGSLKLPEELGTIQEVYVPDVFGKEPLSSPIITSGSDKKLDRLVIYLQSAHANYDSETNSKRIIEFLQKEYNLPLVLLEGGEGALDSLFFKSFPDEGLKEKALLDYVRKGDLSGGEISSILNEAHHTKYFGIEAEGLYEENKEAFLRAIEREDEIRAALEKIEAELIAQSKTIFTEKVQFFYEKHSAFHAEEVNLMEYIKELKEFYETASERSGETDSVHGSFGSRIRRFELDYPELGKILAAQSNEKRFEGEDFDVAMTKMVQAFREKVLPRLPKPKQVEMNQLIQMQRIGHLSEGLLVKRIEQLSREMNFVFQTPEVLMPAAQHAATLSSIKGTKLFDELARLERDLSERLPESEGEGALLRDFHHLEMLKNFARLEIVHEDWQLLRECGMRNAECGMDLLQGRHREEARRADVAISNAEIASPARELWRARNDVDSLFADHFRFYELACARDEALFRNALKLMEKEDAKMALISTGGFHSEGITKRLKDERIPYILISPKVNQIGDRANYLSVMRGHRSFMKYFNGSLWDALAQDYAAKLAASLKESELTPSLKKWRDRIIQNSIAEGRITDAGQYTKYVDALVQALRKEYEKGSDIDALSGDQIRKKLEAELNSYLGTYFDKLESLLKQRLNIFGGGLKELWKTGDITPETIGKLIDRINTVKTSNLALKLALTHQDLGGALETLKGFDAADREDVLKRVQNLSPDGLKQLRALIQAGISAESAELAAALQRHPKSFVDEVLNQASQIETEKIVDAVRAEIRPISPVSTPGPHAVQPIPKVEGKKVPHEDDAEARERKPEVPPAVTRQREMPDGSLEIQKGVDMVTISKEARQKLEAEKKQADTPRAEARTTNQGEESKQIVEFAKEGNHIDPKKPPFSSGSFIKTVS
ncbi:MAG: hypothetical protein HY584_01870 [Candidatus Omnitrophica bacterium]|nr:hypothetical protein [Candidatus Omnitrophota bacterium]